jgi:5-(carboxyamino)imidazole ribonucleotide mutase
MNPVERPLVAIVMGSKSDWDLMRHSDETLARFDVAHEARVLSAHRTPDQLRDYITQAESRGVEVWIAAAGGAAHLAGVVAAHTVRPVLGVPIPSTTLNGLDSLLAIVQMPAGIPVGTLAIGKPGATNAALLAVSILANSRPPLAEKLREFRAEQANKVLGETLP